MGKYDDIINLKRPVSKHPKIDIYKQKMIMQNGAIIDIKEIIDINSDIFKNLKFE